MSVRITLKDARGKRSAAAVLKPPAEDHCAQLLKLAATKLRLSKPSRFYDVHTNELSIEQIQHLTNGAVVVVSVGPLVNTTRCPEARCSHIPEPWGSFLAPHLLAPSGTERVPVSRKATHLWLAVDASGVYFRVPEAEWATVENMLRDSSPHFLHHVYVGRPRRLQLDLDGSPVPPNEVAAVLVAGLKAQGHHGSCAVAEAPPKAGESGHWGHLTFPHIVAADDKEHDWLKSECRRVLEEAVPCEEEGRWSTVVDRAQSATLRCLGSDKWDEENHKPEDRATVPVVCLDENGVALEEVDWSWYCPLIRDAEID